MAGRSETEALTQENLKRLRARTRLEAAIVADHLLKDEGGLEETFEDHFATLSLDDKRKFDAEAWVAREVHAVFAAARQQLLEA